MDIPVSSSLSVEMSSTSTQQNVVPNRHYAIKSFIAGGVAGMCAKTTTAPLDRLKILLQAQHVQYKNYSVVSGLGAIWRHEGFLGFYKGNGAQLVRIFPYAAIQFMAYEQYKKLLRPYFSQRTHTSKLIAGSMTGITAVTFTYPLDVVRARLAFQVHEKRYVSIWHTITSVLRTEGGPIGLFRGFSSTILGMIPYAGVAFYTYEVTKSLMIKWLPLRATRQSRDGSNTIVLTIPASFFCGGMSGAFAQTVSYPLDVVRRVMQLEGMKSEKPIYRSVLGTLSHIYKTSGVIKGLYRGMTINYYRAIPTVAMSFTVYELMKQRLGISQPL